MSSQYQGAINFPNPFASKIEKDKYTYGLQVFNAIMGATASYKQKREEQIEKVRTYARGKQGVQQYLDQIVTSGKLEWTNVSYKPVKYVKNIENIVVDGYMHQEETPRATATSQHILDRKDRKKSDLRFRLQYGALVEQISQEVGFPMEDPSQEVPEDEEQLDIYTDLNDREREEVLMQEMVEFCLRENKFDEKKKIYLTDTFETNFAGFYNYVDEKGRVRVKVIRPEDALYDTSFEEHITSEGTYAGHRERAYIVDIRQRFNISKEQEQKLYECAKASVGNYGNPATITAWNEDWRFRQERPYDNFMVEIYHIWYKCSKDLGYIIGKDSKGREIFESTWDTEKLKNRYKNHPTKRTEKKTILTAYEGWFVKGGSLTLEWGESQRVLKPFEDLDDILNPYIFYMPDNQGTMDSESAIDRMIPYIDNMEVAMLRIKQAIANAAPSGYAIDLDALQSVNIGTGKDLVPLEVMDIYKETGNLFYRSTKGTGEDPISQMPVQPLVYNIQATIQGYVDWYNQNLEYIRQAIGVNEFRDGTASNPRTGFRFAQTQLETSNTATYYIYRSFINASDELIKQVGIRIWHELLYQKPNEGYLKYLGKENVEFIKRAKEITSSSYDFKFQLEMSGADEAYLEQNIQTALASGAIEMSDAIMIRRIKSLPLAERMLMYYNNKRKKQAQENAERLSQLNAQAQAQAGQAVEQAKQQTVQIQSEYERDITKVKGENERSVKTLDIVKSLIDKYGADIPEQFLPLVQQVLLLPTMESENNANSVEQEMQQKAQAEQQQQMEQELMSAVQNGDITEEEAMVIAQQQMQV